MRGARGALLAEAIVSLTLGLIVLAAFVGALVGSLRWIAAAWERAESLDLVHTVWTVVGEELRPGIPGRDWRVHESGGWVELRAFRGIGRLCLSGAGSGSWSVAYRGRRDPEVGRDSVLVLGADGGWRAFALESVQGGGACAGGAGEVAQRWGWSQGGEPRPILARLYERGEYHLADGAFRYRRGAGGRQPLVPERLGAASRYSPTPGGLELQLELISSQGRPTEVYRWEIRGSGPVTAESGSP